MSDSSRNAGLPSGEEGSVRARLGEERVTVREQITALEREFEGIVEANTLVAVDDEHDPEGASTAFERAHVAALLAREREHLTEVDRALERLDRGDFGRCEECGEAIPAERLEVRPAATTCVHCAAQDPRRRRRAG
ncbi:TraR/DksA family transcriptional regulator [Streptomyces sp. NBC_01497]|uniref:TraR/DksA family transcriptional regulator n=1 Tax=Streptomyces sp. NBC_01497 TaxID=2903885 RepID=UPI002E2F4DB3|nr:TraR/DksA C4-type zinc finger protein [Streptomyces sp. NBC_01497]